MITFMGMTADNLRSSTTPGYFQKLRARLKETTVGMKIYYSEFWQKNRNPYKYIKHQQELAFYSKVFFDHANQMQLIFDVGANVGDKSAVFSKLSKKVIAFEPTRRLQLLLKKRFRHKNVTVLDYALGSNAGRLEFYEVNDNAAYNSLSRKHIDTVVPARNIAENKAVQTREIQVERIEHFIGVYGVPDYIKIDVEGYEIEVIKGLATPVPLLSFEANLPDFLEESIAIIRYLDSLGAGSYTFNIVYEDIFLLNEFASSSRVIESLRSSNKPCVEIYAKRKTN